MEVVGVCGGDEYKQGVNGKIGEVVDGAVSSNSKSLRETGEIRGET